MPSSIISIEQTRNFSVKPIDGLRFGNFEGTVYLPPIIKDQATISEESLSSLNNRQIYRTICDWFESWRPWQQHILLCGIVDRCSIRQLDIIATTLEPIKHRDYTTAFRRRYPSTPFRKLKEREPDKKTERKKKVKSATDDDDDDEYYDDDDEYSDLIPKIDEEEEGIEKQRHMVPVDRYNSASSASGSGIEGLLRHSPFNVDRTLYESFENGGPVRTLTIGSASQEAEETVIFQDHGKSAFSLDNFAENLASNVLQSAISEITGVNALDNLVNIANIQNEEENKDEVKKDDQKDEDKTPRKKKKRSHKNIFKNAQKNSNKNVVALPKLIDDKMTAIPENSLTVKEPSGLARSLSQLSKSSLSKARYELFGKVTISTPEFLSEPKPLLGPVQREVKFSDTLKLPKIQNLPVPIEKSYKAVKFWPVSPHPGKVFTKPKKQELENNYRDQLHEIWNWLSMWEDYEKITLLKEVLLLANPEVLSFLSGYIQTKLQYARDINRLQDNLLLYILSFLSPEDIGLAAQVCRRWRYLCAMDDLWMIKCHELGVTEGIFNMEEIVRLANKNLDGIDWKLAYIEIYRILKMMKGIMQTKEVGKKGDTSVVQFLSITSEEQLANFSPEEQAILKKLAMQGKKGVRFRRGYNGKNLPDSVTGNSGYLASKNYPPGSIQRSQFKLTLRAGGNVSSHPDGALRIHMKELHRSVSFHLENNNSSNEMKKNMIALSLSRSETSGSFILPLTPGSQKSNASEDKKTDIADVPVKRWTISKLQQHEEEMKGEVSSDESIDTEDLDQYRDYVYQVKGQSAGMRSRKWKPEKSFVAATIFGEKKNKMTDEKPTLPPADIMPQDIPDEEREKLKRSKTDVRYLQTFVKTKLPGKKKREKEDAAFDIRTDLVQAKDLLGKSSPSMQLEWRDEEQTTEDKPASRYMGVVKSVRRVRKLQGHLNGVMCCQFDKRRLITAGLDRTVRIWDVRSGRSIHKFYGHKGGIHCLLFEYNLLLTGSWDTTIIAWDLKTFDKRIVLTQHSGCISSLQMNADYIVSGSHDMTVRVWHRRTFMCFRTITGHSGPIMAVTLHKDNIVSASTDKTLRLVNIHSGECLKVFQDGQDQVLSVVMQGDLIISGDIKGRVFFWNKGTGESEAAIQAHEAPINMLKYHKGRFVTASGDGTVREWDLLTLTSVRLLQGHKGPVRDVQITSDRIVTGSDDGTVRIWDLFERKPATFR